MKSDYLEKREIPILMCTYMVRAIDQNRKTQTRRIIKLKDFCPSNTPGFDWSWRDKRGCWNEASNDWLIKRYCPYGKPGDVLWVRETWSYSIYALSSMKDEDGPFVYKADSWGNERRLDDLWHPSIFMPRTAARFLLGNQNVRIQHVQDISREDAIAEGIRVLPLQDASDPSAWWEAAPGKFQAQDPILSYAKLWDSLNAKPKPVMITIDGKKYVDHYESYPWEKGKWLKEYNGRPWLVIGNPYVWVIEFRKVERDGI